MENTIENIIKENERRRAAALNVHYDPLTGDGCGGRRALVSTPVPSMPRACVPETMVADPDFARAVTPQAWERLRCRHDFEFWCARCVRIKDKVTRREVPFTLNAPQRRVVGILEGQRLSGKPLRVIILKARQWGCSTLIQMYMAWVQSCLRRNWNSLICAHVKDSAANIRGMYTDMLAAYPAALWEGEEDAEGRPVKPEFKPFERSQNCRVIAGRGCRVTLASAENQDSIRGADISMAHLTEVAFWPATGRKTPQAFVQAICGAVTREPLTLIAMESTACGVGNFFHTEWLRCKEGQGDKTAIFVPWHEIAIYSRPVSDPVRLWQQLTPYERGLWDRGLTLEQIAWYHDMARSYSSELQMHAEFPTDDIEAFASTGRNVFASAHIEALREMCQQPAHRGELRSDGSPGLPANGPYEEWDAPQAGKSYIAAVDVGGRSAGADWSVIVVLTREEAPRVVAQWRGHIDHDRLIDIAISIATRYNKALLAIESNTLESECDDTSDPSQFCLARAMRSYTNLYYRQAPLGSPGRMRPGFHTNRATKTTIISEMVERVREGRFVERSHEACNELATYTLTDRGTYEAAPGYHDDMLMARAIALHICIEQTLNTTRNPPLTISTW